ncbi:GNAT family N-acetyltransferase [Algisphaera agarilytica]|uniref:Ribosomal protein S18 acetylase RimI-like enzyme n=1 Tax=Algisphaera agarilytica TaxID=1385975 RepID=A0A7X0H8Y1_9BACT|nr:GNAT family N-acetyltransferase [Algisphaera agarilytica]MBB6430000.1 ribosomal protein S18 acetylase RimI-like enzyme [Algisphaera agarilytica]
MSPPASPTNPAPTARFERVGQALQRDALSVLLTGQRNPDDPAVAPFLAFAQQNSLDLSGLWVAWDGRRLAASTLIVPGVGKTAMLFLSPVGSHGRVSLSGQLIAWALSEVDAVKIRLIQTLLEQGQNLQQRAFEAGGFRFLAELAYMQRPGKVFAPLPPVTLDGEILTPVHWSESARPVFSQAISESYEGTQDCPGLLGLREMDDIIAGHMATGRFDPAHWTVWRDGLGRPAGVLLLAESTGNAGFELVYLGVSPHARGQGLSKVLMRYALDLTHKHGRGDLFLAVDDRNTPALRLYQGLGFRVSIRKTALIYTP